MTTLEIIKWMASACGMIAAVMVAANLGRKVPGVAFVIFTASSLFWIAGGLMDEEGALTTQNVVMLVINLAGIYRWLIRDEERPGTAGTEDRSAGEKAT